MNGYTQHTIVFDRGCNSKQNLKKVGDLNLHYVGALTPSHHKDLIKEAESKSVPTTVGNDVLEVYRDKKVIWGEERTVLVFISQKLKDGQLRACLKTLKQHPEVDFYYFLCYQAF